MEPKTVIQINRLQHSYKSFEKGETLKDMFKDLFNRKHVEIPSLKDVSFSVREGEVLGLLGANGAGKTTLLKVLSGLLMPKEGSVEVLGENPFKKSNHYLSQIGYVFGQKSQLNWDLPSYDTFELLGAIYSIPEAELKNRIERFSKLLNFSGKLRTPVRKLSLGERMKAELICSLLHMPKILFLDEPTIGLDIVSQKAIHEFVREIVQTNKVSVILTSHYMSDIEILADRICVLQNGVISFSGTVQELTAIRFPNQEGNLEDAIYQMFSEKTGETA